jgi:hypothetical protein
MTKANNRIGKAELSAAIGRAVGLETARIELLQACQVDEVSGGSAEDIEPIIPGLPGSGPTMGYFPTHRPRPQGE